MDEARIKALYRARIAQQDRGLDDQLAEDIPAALTGYGWPSDEAGPVDRIAASATAGAIMRVVAEMAPESEALAQQLRQARAPRKAPVGLYHHLQRGFAVAAGVGAMALLFAIQTQPVNTAPEEPVASQLRDSDIISVVSFESGETKPAADVMIFSGSFGT